MRAERYNNNNTLMHDVSKCNLTSISVNVESNYKAWGYNASLDISVSGKLAARDEFCYRKLFGLISQAHKLEN